MLTSLPKCGEGVRVRMCVHMCLCVCAWMCVCVASVYICVRLCFPNEATTEAAIMYKKHRLGIKQTSVRTLPGSSGPLERVIVKSQFPYQQNGNNDNTCLKKMLSKL